MEQRAPGEDLRQLLDNSVLEEIRWVEPRLPRFRGERDETANYRTVGRDGIPYTLGVKRRVSGNLLLCTILRG